MKLCHFSFLLKLRVSLNEIKIKQGCISDSLFTWGHWTPRILICVSFSCDYHFMLRGIQDVCYKYQVLYLDFFLVHTSQSETDQWGACVWNIFFFQTTWCPWVSTFPSYILPVWQPLQAADKALRWSSWMHPRCESGIPRVTYGNPLNCIESDGGACCGQMWHWWYGYVNVAIAVVKSSNRWLPEPSKKLLQSLLTP